MKGTNNKIGLFAVLFLLLLGTVSAVTQITNTDIYSVTNVNSTNFNGVTAILTGLLSGVAATFSGQVNGTVFKGSLTGNADTATTWNGETSQADLNVNSSNYWDGLDVPTDLNNKLTLACQNVTGASSNLCTITDTTYTAGQSLTLTGTQFNVTADSIGDTQLAFNTGQALTTASDAAFNALDVGGSFTAANGTTISGGNIWSGGNIYILGNITASTVSNLNFNGSNLPTITDTFSIGSSALKWLDGWFSNNVSAANGFFTTIYEDGTSLVSKYLGIADQRFNETSIVNAVNSSLQSEITLQADNNVTQATAIGLKSNTASPTFTGTVTIPTPFTIGAVSLTTTGTILNYLTSAAGTTGTTSTNLVFSTSPVLTTPTLGVASATSLNTGFGDNELYAMNQGVTTTSNVLFNTLNTTGVLRIGGSTLGNAALFIQTTTAGGTLGAVRNLDSASTNSPIVYFQQNNAGDDQAVMSLTQAGSGNYITAGNFSVSNTGTLTTTNITFAHGGKNYDNATCTIILSPAGTGRLEVCD